MAPTAVSKSSAKRMSSARRAALAALFCASWAAASRSALAMACTLNSSTALAISPSSSLRPRPGSTTSKLPAASSRIALHIAVIGREMPLPRKNARIQPSRKPPAASIRISRSVSPMVACDSGFEPLLIGEQGRLHRARTLVDGGGRLPSFRASVRRFPLHFRSAWPSACRYSSSMPETSLMPCRIVSLVDEIAFSAFSTNLRRASALCRDRLVGIDHEGIGKRGYRLKLLGSLSWRRM